MYFTIYQVKNLINSKIYIGKHQTKNLDDGYMGSGKHLKRAIQKYGIENFEKTILFVFETEDEMNLKERELVTEDFCKRKDTYNICEGGKGGFGYINNHGLFYKGMSRKEFNIYASPFTKNNTVGEKIRLKASASVIEKQSWRKGIEIMRNLQPAFYGRTHTEESKQKMRKPKNVGSDNPSYGTCWITNGTENKKIKKGVSLPKGWIKGRTV